VLPKASITISTDTSTVNSNLTLTLDSTAKSFDPAQLVVPAKVEQVQKNNSQQVPTTGQKNEGQKATGTVTLSIPCSSVNNGPVEIPAGTGVSTNSLTFITQSTTDLTTSNFKGGCHFTGDTGVTAQTGGAQYNIADGMTFAVSGYPDVSGTNDNAFSGGTDNIVKVVAQTDIDSATKKISAQDTSSVKQQLEQQLKQDGLYAVTSTLNAGTPVTTTSANVGDQADNVTVTEVTTYTMLGVKQSDLKSVVDNDVKDQIDPSKQSILDEGLSNATFRVITNSGTGAQVAMSTVATAGPDLNVDSLKKQVAGKKSGDVVSLLKSNPGVTDVKVKLSPFWVNAVPKKPSKITIIFNKTVTHVKTKPNANNP
jgi:hypothetical protein